MPSRDSEQPIQLVSPQPPLQNTLPGLDEFLEPIRAHWWVVVLALILSAAASVVWTRAQPQEYEARATLIVGKEAPRFLGDEAEDVRVNTGPRGRFEYTQYLETQLYVLRSRPVMERVVDALKLGEDDVYLGIDPAKAERQLTPSERRDRAVEVLTNRTRVVPIDGSQMVAVVTWDFDAEHAALVANTAIAEYIGYNKELTQQSMTGALEWLNTQSTELRSEVELSERALYTFRSTHGLLSTPAADQRTTEAQRVEELGAQLTRAEVRRIELTSDWEETSRLMGEGQIEASRIIANDPNAAGLKAQLIALEKKDAEMSSSLGPNHHKVVSLRAELDYTQRRYDTEVGRLVDGLEAQLAGAVSAETKLRARLADQTNSAVEVSKLETEYRALQREMENSRRLYELVAERLKTVELASLLDTSNIQGHERARAPEFPVRPRLSLNVVLGLVLGLGLGLVGALGLDQLNQTVRDEAELERTTGLKVLGEIPAVADNKGGGKPRDGDERKGSADRYVSRFPRSHIAEAFRGLRTNLLFMRPNANFRTLLVTSAGIGEGKTSVSTNLAIALAAASKKVCVVDTDLRRPRVHKVFDIDNDGGLTMILIGEMSIDEGLVQVGENLWVLRSGPVPPNPSELLASPAFAAIVTELKHRFDTVIFDSPPAALLSDASMLSQRTDGVLLVVRAESTPRNLLKRALRNLSAVNAEILGGVVNGKRRESGRGYGYGKYGYSYGKYGYGHYGDYLSDADENAAATDEDTAGEQPTEDSAPV